MFAIFRILFLGSRLVLASVMGLVGQVFLLINGPDHLLNIQNLVKDFANFIFSELSFDSQYRVAYNLIGGDNLLVHTLFVLCAYLLLLIVFLPFTRRRKRRTGYYS